jgi:hypothetical protein
MVRRWLGSVLGLGLGLTLLGPALAGCGQASVPTPTCGTVYVNHLGQVSNGAQAAQAETCFYQAFQQCQQASLGVSYMSGVDSGAQSIFSVQTGGGGGGVAPMSWSRESVR